MAAELLLEVVEAEDPGREDDFVFIESLPTLVRRSDDSATWLGLASCSCDVPATAVLVFLVLPLALSPPRPSRPLLPPLLKDDDDLDFELSLPVVVEERLTADVDLGAGGEDIVTLTAGCLPHAVIMFLGLFCPVLLVVPAVPVVEAMDDSLLPLPTLRMEGSEGNRDIMGGLGGRADVNLGCVSVLLVAVEPALVFFFCRLGEEVSLFSKTGESWSLFPLLLGALSRPLIPFAPTVVFFEVVALVSTDLRRPDGLFGAAEVVPLDFLPEEDGLLLITAVG